ncbi:hypothetical protein D3C87_1698760 [compost metagenome]
MAYQLKAVYQFYGLFFIAVQFKRQHCAEPVLQVLFGIGMVGAALQSGIAHSFYCFMVFQPAGQGQSVVYMTLHAK